MMECGDRSIIVGKCNLPCVWYKSASFPSIGVVDMGLLIITGWVLSVK